MAQPHSRLAGALLRRRYVARLLVLRCLDELCVQMLSVAIGWYVYSRTHSALSLAYVGLSQFAPNLVCSLIAGQSADRLERRTLLCAMLTMQCVCALALALLVGHGATVLWPLYAVLVLMGSARTFAFPPMMALPAQLLEGADFPQALALICSAAQVCGIAGPAIGGLLYGLSAITFFCLCAALYLLAALLAAGLPGVRGAHEAAPAAAVLGGLRYIRAHRLLLALTSLDLFAVLLGGVTALLPIYARDILHVGPSGLGGLRCAPGIGAVLVGALLARRALHRAAGKWMLGCVAGFAVATAVFALSRQLVLSMLALIAAGGFDMVSMVIRETLMQLSTPDALRGRVNAVVGLSISASSELGQFESGLAAAWFGTVPAALLGGIGCLLVVGLWALLFPELRQAQTPTLGTVHGTS